jgi:hypothetical protein
MARKRQVTPMETQPIRSQIEAATPMASPSKPSKAARRSTPPNYAKPSCYGQEALTQEAAQHAARLRAGSATS